MGRCSWTLTRRQRNLSQISSGNTHHSDRMSARSDETAESSISTAAETYPPKDDPVLAQLAATCLTMNAAITPDRLSTPRNSLASSNHHADVDMSESHQQEYTESEYEPTIRNPTRPSTPTPSELDNSFRIEVRHQCQTSRTGSLPAGGSEFVSL